MSERSELIKRILHIWDSSDEGQKYLEWLLEPGTEALDGGAVLREAVLDAIEDDEQLNDLRQQKQDAGLAELLSSLPPKKRESIKKCTLNLEKSLRLQAEAFRGEVRTLGEIRRKLNLERLDALKLISQIRHSQDSHTFVDDPDVARALALFEKVQKNLGIARAVAAKVASLSRTQAERLNLEAEWRLHSAEEEPQPDDIKRIADDPGEDSFNNHHEKFDRFYAQQLVTKLEGIVDRVSALDPVNLRVKSPHVSRLFREAHDAFLFGFDAAAIALCRCLLEHALKDRLAVNAKKTLKALIPLARKTKVLTLSSLGDAQTVQQAGNDLMHDVKTLRLTAKEVLDSTRRILTELYEAVGSV